VGLWSFLQNRSPGTASALGETESVRKIVRQLEAMDLQRARYVAAFAYVLGRVANAEAGISEEETRAMEKIVSEIGGLSEEQALLVVQISKSQNVLFGGTENFLVSRELREVATPQERSRLLDALFAVSAADDSISSAEEAQIRQIADELGFTLEEFVAARARYSDKRAVLRGLGPGK
jgi:uncharacterized tellurite resistance protein B-like protein